MRWSRIAGIGLGLIAGLAVVAKGVSNSRKLLLKEEIITIPELPPHFEGFRLLHLTDLHLRQGSPKIEQLLEMVEDIDPDLVCLTGDYAFTALSLSDVERFLRGLALRPAVVGVYGNADYRPGITPEVRAHWAQIVPFLANSALCLERQGERLWVVGVDDPHTGRDCLEAAMTLVPPEAPVILLAHSPEVILRKLSPQVRLLLAGHTHGGQICLPGGKALYNNMRLPAMFSSGRFALPHGTMYVSSGVGSTRLPVRYGCLPEITLFTLTRDGKDEEEVSG